MLTTDRRALIQAVAAATAVAALGGITSAAAAADASIYVIAELVAKPDQAEALKKLMVEFVAGARKEPGCKHYSLLEDNKQPGRLMTFETWADQASIDAHMTTPQIKAVAPKLGPLLAKPFTIAQLSMVSDG